MSERATSNSLESAGTLPSRLFTNAHDVYLASADRMDEVKRNLAQIVDPAGSCDLYATVVGGLSGLNYLAAIEPKRLLFYDLNPDALRYGELVVELVRMSASPEDLIGRVFGRSVAGFLDGSGETSLDVVNQLRYLEQPVEDALVLDTLQRLTPRGRASWDYFLRPHLCGHILDGVRNCRRLLPCWPPDRRVPVGAGEATGTNHEGVRVPNTNTWFYGHGWLGSPEAYSRVRRQLTSLPIMWMCLDLLDANLDRLASPRESVVLHVSNIDEWFPDAWPRLVHRLQTQARDADSTLLILSSPNGVIPMPADPHDWAYRALAPHVIGSLVEVAHKVPWGFHEYSRVNVVVSEYIEGAFPADTAILHILLGEGIDRPAFLAAYRAALRQSRRVIVLEHERESADWGPAAPERFVTKAELEDLLMTAAGSLRPRIAHSEHITGDVDTKRNILVVLDV